MQVVEKIGSCSKIVIQIILVLVCSVMMFFEGVKMTNMVLQSAIILSIFLFGIIVDPSIAILMTCILLVVFNKTLKIDRRRPLTGR